MTIDYCVTGGNGFISSHLCKELTDQGAKVVALVRDQVPSRWLDLALQKCIIVRGDLRDMSLVKRVLNDYEVRGILHLAAQPVVKNALRDPASTYENNVISTVNMLEAARVLDIPRVLIQSTDKVYGNRMEAKETDPYSPTDPYSTSKIACDVIARSYIQTYGMEIVIPRPCNVYGFDTASRIVPNTVRACLRGDSPVIFKGEETKRQYIYVTDLVQILLHLAENEEGPVNVVGPDLLTQEEVVTRILEFFPGMEPRYVERERPPEIVEQSMIGHPELERFLKHSFDQGIQETIKRFKEFG